MILRWRTRFDPSSRARIAMRISTSRPCVRISKTSTLASLKSPRSKFNGKVEHLQRRRRLRRVAIPNSQALSLLGRDLREAHLQVLLGGGGYRSNNASVSNGATDPFLSSLILNFPTSESEEISKSVVTNADDTSAKNGVPTHIWKSSVAKVWSLILHSLVGGGDEMKSKFGTFRSKL
ncbi:hypothetical protein FEM48_Zijuj01G0159200 [Ziziphus jujuba var. spinosa]|uniref:Di19 C-terminal domain-containing protein n=1 Tax=Ziziphus jujuba var. spinosa TaxID=714518 RepID=A0A978W263_ZIZJJ|nr:hypothetical protein FEM48_Zijuj01G0159200 [Ziziphus jujuba var. spinosa]